MRQTKFKKITRKVTLGKTRHVLNPALISRENLFKSINSNLTQELIFHFHFQENSNETYRKCSHVQKADMECCNKKIIEALNHTWKGLACRELEQDAIFQRLLNN
jgi:hypothetical protein